MNLDLDRSTWKRVALRDVVRHITDRVDPETSGLERFLAGEHIPSESLEIRDWGVIGQDPIGPMFYKRFQPGHVLYVSRRAYLRKTAVPEFTGICGEKTFVLETLDEEVLSQNFLPFVLSAERFHAYAVAMSRGSVNPYINWTDIAAYEFDLPSPEEQRRIADLLWAVERQMRSSTSLREATSTVRRVWLDRAVESLLTSSAVDFKCVWRLSPASGYSAAPVDEDTGRYVLSLAALGPEGYRTGNLKSVPDTAEVRSAALSQGDVLISRANTVDTVGRAGIFSEDRNDVSFPDTMMRLRLVPEVLPEFAVAVLMSSHGRAHMRRTAAGSATSMVKINRASLGRLAFPLIDVEQQASLLDRLAVFDAALAAAEMQESALASTKHALSTTIFGGAG
ncbi:restriction endonuclease subunit S [Streptomyces sp. NRRL S-146]|uniref:restriction endonuclease subunit S n=1 Tax=Streptomyces sp. NRRL S-146 TaxID=1463884 RepID=UPI00068AD183|nr:restriction endonuclease subunit S [Streptomyces sp. NRRL S-146]